MKKVWLVSLALLAHTAIGAEEKILFDFENYAIGETVPMNDIFNGSNTESRATVVADPIKAQNKVMHITNKSWNTTVEITLAQMTAEEITGDYQYLAFDLYRPSTDGEYKQFSARIGADTIYADADFVTQGAADQWVERSYRMTKVSNTSDKLYMGYNSNDADFYIDNVRLVSSDLGYDYTDETQTLRYFAEKCGKKIGVAIPLWRIDVNNENLVETATVSHNFNMVVAENEMKVDAIQPNRGEFNFYAGDCLVSLAERHDMEVRGHTLVWHKQLPAWISSNGIKNDHNYTREELLQILNEHVTTVVTHFKGHVDEWDVVNECLDDDQSIIRTNPTGYKLRESVWATVIGEDYIDSAFVYAHRADPDARLVLNDYGAEFQGKAKTTAFYNLVRRLQKSGIPLDGVGFQCHLTVGEEFDSTKFDNNIKRYASLGLECTVTELDMSIPDLSAPDAYERQAAEYAALVDVMMKYDHCRAVVVWGVKDDQSWRQGAPLLFNAAMEAKPAFFALRNILEEYAQTGGVEYCTVSTETLPPYVDVYDVMGRSVALQLERSQIGNLPSGFYIVEGQGILIH